ncbi:MAG: hypothetical protein Q9162_002160 [Coniocarpon cinnabarinum]
MGTHISRVKSVDLDSWTDEQLASILKWGNTRANKYWEAKLAPGHVPAESWPLNVVQEKAKLERSASNRTSSAPASRPLEQPRLPPKQFNLFDVDDVAAPAPRPNSVATPGSRPPPDDHQAASQTKPNKPGDSLLGFDFFGPTSGNPPPRPNSAAASTPGTSSGPSRPDLKQSILSLYAAKPNPPPEQEQQQRSAPGMQHSKKIVTPGGLDEAFGSLDFTASTQSTQSVKPTPFANLTSPTSPPMSRSNPNIGGGNFFEAKASESGVLPAQVQQSQRVQRGLSSSSGFGDFASGPMPITKNMPANAATRHGNGLTADLFDFSAPANLPASAASSKNPPPVQVSNFSSSNLDASVFNLSSVKAPEIPQKSPEPPAPPPKPVTANALDDPWGASDIWASSDTTAASMQTQPSASTPSVTHTKSPPAVAALDDFGGWTSSTSPAPTMQAHIRGDEDFGGWESQPSANAAAPTTTSDLAPQAPPKPAGGGIGGNDDLFSNVWE